MPPKKATSSKSKGGEKSYDDMTVAELKEVLKEKGLDTTGKKADLLARVKGDGEPNTTTKTVSKRGRDHDDDSDHEETTSSKKPKKVETDAPKEEARSSGRVKAQKQAATEKENSVGKWGNDGSLYYLDSPSIVHSNTIIGFDMDDTLIETQSGKTFATSRNDWQWLYPEVPKKLKELHEQGKKVIIFTNQGGIDGKNGFDRAKYGQITGKIEDLSAELGFPLQAFIATTEDEYRKPSTTMWDFMVKNCNGGIKPDVDKCIYVGDAAGRAAGWAPGRKKDFSCSDRKFAHNIGIKFSTPEEFFKNEPSAAFTWDSADLTSVATKGTAEITEGGVKTLTAPDQEMVLFVGFPASGKSTLAKKYMVPAGYVHVNRDTLKTQDKCLKAAKEAVSSGKSVVIDNTNPDPSVRATYIAVAKSAKIPVRCFRFDVDEDLAKHLNMFRERVGISAHVPRIGYAMYKKNFQEPTLAEGFSEIKKIRFVADFENAEHEKVFNQKA